MLLRCSRIFAAVFCAIVIAQQSNLGSLAFCDECRDNCPDNDASHRCPLNCTSCTCVGHGTPVSLTLTVPATARPVMEPIPCEVPTRQPDPQPDAIFHVPRPDFV